MIYFLIIFMIICGVIVMICNELNKIHAFYCPKCGSVHGFVGKPSQKIPICNKCHHELSKVPEEYVSKKSDGYIIDPLMEDEFNKIYIQPLIDLYGVPVNDKHYYCKHCGTIEAFHFPRSTDKLQCTICFSQLHELPEKYIEDIKWKNGLGSSSLLNEEIKNTDDFNQDISNRKQEIHEEQMRPIRESMELGKKLLEERTKGVTCIYCGSPDVVKIGTFGRTVSVAMYGLASSNIGKQWHCNNCNSDF
ncbi:MAG: hypothetical protein IJZ53_10030 [Tyzzerella sp.]|nr:hypothetical protein [Tyzzerella sp.]